LEFFMASQLDLGTAKALFDSDPTIKYILTIKVDSRGEPRGDLQKVMLKNMVRMAKGNQGGPVGHTWVQLSRRDIDLPAKYAGGHSGESGWDSEIPSKHRGPDKLGTHYNGMIYLWSKGKNARDRGILKKELAKFPKQTPATRFAGSTTFSVTVTGLPRKKMRKWACTPALTSGALLWMTANSPE
jgi:hypothetical protein